MTLSSVLGPYSAVQRADERRRSAQRGGVRSIGLLGVTGLTSRLRPSSVSKHDRGFNLPRRDRPVCSEKAILISA